MLSVLVNVGTRTLVNIIIIIIYNHKIIYITLTTTVVHYYLTWYNIITCMLQIRNQQRNQTRRGGLPEGWSWWHPDLGSPRRSVLHSPRRFGHQHRIHLRRERLPTGRLSLAHTTPNSS